MVYLAEAGPLSTDNVLTYDTNLEIEMRLRICRDPGIVLLVRAIQGRMEGLGVSCLPTEQFLWRVKDQALRGCVMCVGPPPPTQPCSPRGFTDHHITDLIGLLSK